MLSRRFAVSKMEGRRGFLGSSLLVLDFISYIWLEKEGKCALFACLPGEVIAKEGM